MNFKDKKVTVMGLGLHGGALGTIEWLRKQGAELVVTDMKTEEQLAPSVKKLKKYKNVTLVLGQHRTEDFTTASLVIRNPAVPKNSPHLLAAKKAGVPIEMDSSLFFLHSPTQDIIGVTGSKGKTTTSHAITHLLSAHQIGTDGVSPLGRLSNIKSDSTVVFELSSWRLEALESHEISPRTAVVTSIYPEHLNTYSNFEEYVAVKKLIIQNQKSEDITILNYDDEHLRNWESDVKGNLYWFSNATLPDGVFGIYTNDISATVRIPSRDEVVIPLNNLPFFASHEKRNVLPAILLSVLREHSVKAISKKLSSLPRLPHRLETVKELNGITFVNDSAATMPHATIAALRFFGTKPLILIAGGGDKKLTFEELAQEIPHHLLRGIVWLPGTATETMKKSLQSVTHGIPSVDADSMPDAVTKAAELAQHGDYVLLSPGATSFGLFLHEFDRGQQFKDAVANIK